MEIQLTFWPETMDVKVEKKLLELEIRQEKSRKSQFAKISELKKLYSDVESRLNYLESAICKGEILNFK